MTQFVQLQPNVRWKTIVTRVCVSGCESDRTATLGIFVTQIPRVVRLAFVQIHTLIVISKSSATPSQESVLKPLGFTVRNVK